MQPEDSAGRLAVDLSVPYAHKKRDDLLFRQWRSQAGDLLPPPPLTLPERSSGTYRVRIRLFSLLDVVIENQRSGAVRGRSGGQSGHLEDRVVTHLTYRGMWCFASGRESLAVRPGQLCVRRNEAPWDFEVSPGTHALMLSLPAADVRLPTHSLGVIAAQDTPATRLLLSHLRACMEIGAGLGPAARNATIELFNGLLDDQVIDDPCLFPALVRAAEDCIESRLLSDPRLDPRGIAATLHISVRTLHRAFADSGASVMERVRQRRLERARADLISTSWTVSEIASRWNFTDSSHFIRAYKKRFGETPTATRTRHNVNRPLA
jgi:AraC-like DNA-binding protein